MLKPFFEFYEHFINIKLTVNNVQKVLAVLLPLPEGRVTFIIFSPLLEIFRRDSDW